MTATISLVFFFLFITVPSFAQKNPNFSASKSVIVHLFEWKWSDIGEECERYLQYQGYGGVQVSPPNENVIVSGRPWWERYQPVSYNITTRSGNNSEFGDMVARCNKVGIRIYVDAVFNHMAALTGTGTAGNKALSDVKMYPALPYNPDDFHPTCNITNYFDPDVIRDCQINGYRDLDQSNGFVQNKILAYLNNLIDLGVAGFRIDSAKYMWPKDLQTIYASLKNLNTNSGFAANSKAFIYQDVPVFTNDVVGTDEYTGLGTVIDYTYSTAINRVFSGVGNLSSLSNFGPDWSIVPKSTDAVVFIDNPVYQRKGGNILTYKKLKQYKMAIAFLLSYPYGIPKILSSYAFATNDIGSFNPGPPQDTQENIKSPIIYSDGSCGNGFICEHRLPQIANMVIFRNIVDGTNLENWWDDGNQNIAFSRGNKGFVAFSNSGDLVQRITTSLPSGTYCDVISGGLKNGTCVGKSIVVQTGGVASVSILENEFDGVIAIHANSKLT